MNDLLHRWNSLIHKEDVCHRYFKFVLQCPRANVSGLFLYLSRN